MSGVHGNVGADPLFLRFGSPRSSGKMRLYTFAHAGASARTFASWAALLGAEIEVFGVEFAGHGSRGLEEPVTSVHAMAHEVAGAIEQAGDPRPFAFYGHSLGALVAYEAARLLEESPWRPRHLFIGAMRAPHLPRTTTAVAHLADEEFLLAIQERFGGIPQAVLNEPELMAMILPAMRADFVAYEDYVHGEGQVLSCPVTAFAGKRDPIVPVASVARWADHTTGPFEIHTVAGDHFFLTECREQVLGVVARCLQFEVLVPERQ